MKPYTRAQCLTLLKQYPTPDNVIGHCKAVANVSVIIACELNKKGYNLDIALVEAAALLHDMARVKPNHDIVCADFLKEKGHDQEAEIVKVHMRYPKFNKVSNLNETDIVCLGDRLCKDSEYVGLDERMEYILRKAKDNEAATIRIKEKKKEVALFIEDLEQAMGISIDALMEREHERFKSGIK